MLLSIFFISVALYTSSTQGEVGEKSVVNYDSADPVYGSDYYNPPTYGGQPGPTYYGSQTDAGYSHSYNQPYQQPQPSGYSHGQYGGLYGDHTYKGTGYADRFRCNSLKFVDAYHGVGCVVVDSHIPPLDSFTITLWVRVPYGVHDGQYVVDGYENADGIKGYGYETHGDLNDCRFLFTYSVDNGYAAEGTAIYGAEVALGCVGNLHVFVGENHPRATGIAINDGKWHHIALWYAAAGSYKHEGYGGDLSGYNQHHSHDQNAHHHEPAGHHPHPSHDPHDSVHASHPFTYGGEYGGYNPGYNHGQSGGGWCLYLDGWPKAGTCVKAGAHNYLPNPYAFAPFEIPRYIRGYGVFCLGHHIADPGTSLLEQYYAPGTFQHGRVYNGNIHGVHMFSQVIPGDLVRNMALYCYNLCGDVINWFNYWTFRITQGVHIKWQDSYGPPCCKHYCECYELEKRATGLAGYYQRSSYGHESSYGESYGHSYGGGGYGHQQPSGYGHPPPPPPPPQPSYGYGSIGAFSADNDKDKKDDNNMGQKKGRRPPNKNNKNQNP